MTSPGKSAGAALRDDQTQVIHIAALGCACLSLLLVFITLRWFLIMRRCFRHRLVLHLIISDTMKAVWYFIFPIVLFIRGPVASTSKFCQAGGFLLSFAIECSDMAILIIALHCTLCILRPQNTIGEEGLYRYRNWIYAFWLGPALLAASLAFINKEAYVTAGTFCYLPKRPFWYRLALSWVPRYVIILVIVAMYLWIYIYVHLKFRGFDNLGTTDPANDTGIERSAFSTRSDTVDRRGRDPSDRPARSIALGLSLWQPQYQTSSPWKTQTGPELQPWDNMHFLTAKPLEVSLNESTGEEEGRDTEARGSGWSGDTQVLPTNRIGQPIQSEAVGPKHQDSSKGPGAKDNVYEQSHETPPGPMKKFATASDGLNDPLRNTRIAIRKQLRYLFIYPLVYIVMWSLPFASHVLNYHDYYVQHPVFWLSLVSTAMLSLQAGANSIMFSWSEKPWRRVDESSKFSIPFLRRQSKAILQRRILETEPSSTSEPSTPSHPVTDQNPPWWEAEGRRRKDSVWLGTNTILSDAFASIPARTQPRSPQKRTQSLHSRNRSSVQGPAFAPSLEPISPGSALP